MNKLNDNCKGCHNKGSCERYEGIVREIDISKCPCIECLIKGVCSEPCEDFKELFKFFSWVKKYDQDVYI